MSWPYDDPAGRLAERLGIDPAHRRYSGIGGTMPQQLARTRRPSGSLAGELDVAVVVGAEALDTKRRLKKAGERPAWSYRHPEPPPFPFEAPFHPAEIAHEVFQAWLTFAVRDVGPPGATSASRPTTTARSIGELLAPMTDGRGRQPERLVPDGARRPTS